MNTLLTGGPAFPVPSTHLADGTLDGMHLRDYFAAKAMQSLVASPERLEAAIEGVDGDPDTWVAEMSYAMAAAMLKAREAA